MDIHRIGVHFIDERRLARRAVAGDRAGNQIVADVIHVHELDRAVGAGDVSGTIAPVVDHVVLEFEIQRLAVIRARSRIAALLIRKKVVAVRDVRIDGWPNQRP